MQAQKYQTMKKIITILLLTLPIIVVAGPRKNQKNKQEKIEETTIAVAEETQKADSIDDEEISLDDIEVIHEQLPQDVKLEWRGDTLFVSCGVDYLPHRIVVAAQDGHRMFKQMMVDTVKPANVPADSIYKYIWTDARVNPYATPIDSIGDSIHISLKGWRLPHPGYVTSRFGMRRYRFHYGTDIKVQVGDSIHAAWDGMVRIVGYDPRGYGHYMVIRHDNGLETVYGHMSMPLYDENERIYAGDVLGLGGNTGRSTGSHLHFEVRYLGNAFNPEKIIEFESGRLLVPEDYVITQKGTYAHHAEVKQLQSAQYHKVRSGDTLSAIARKYHTKVSTLCKLNRIKESSILQIGQKIRVR